MSESRSQFQEETRFRVLRLLEQNPEMSQRDLAAAVGISTGSTHYVLRALVDKGLVKLNNFTASEDKRRYAYVLTPKGISIKSALMRDFIARKKREYEALRVEIEEMSKEISETTKSIKS